MLRKFADTRRTFSECRRRIKQLLTTWFCVMIKTVINTATTAVSALSANFVAVASKASFTSQVTGKSFIRPLALSATMLMVSAPSHADGLKVVEMFTSQGCYSCPAADKLLGELAEQDGDILNLEFHVDYWNQLQYRGEGNWEDPFSTAAYTQRQRQYSALRLKGENGVYTPQAVINGVYGHVGSNRRALKKGLSLKVNMPVSVNIEKQDDSTLKVSVNGEASVDAGIYLVSFLKRTETPITSGENHDKIMINHNVVVDMKPISSLSDAGDQPIQVAYAGGENLGCAVLVQPIGQGPILGAARCP